MLRLGLHALLHRRASRVLQQPQLLRCLASSAAASPAAPREQMRYDLCIVGAGPAGLSAAIRFKQLCQEDNQDLSVCVVEKGAEVGSHILSGNVFEPRALDELFPDWRQKQEDGVEGFADLPLRQLATQDKFYLLTRRGSIRLPNPPQMKNKRKNYVISLSELTRWLGRQAEAAGVDVFPGFAGKEVLYDWHNAVVYDGPTRLFAPPENLRASRVLQQPQLLRCLASSAAASPAAPREQMRYDLCIVGAGPAGLSAAIRFKQLCQEDNQDLSVCVVEKGAEVGSHILSGNVFEPRALDELFPDWRQKQEDGVEGFADLPLRQLATQDKFYLLTRRGSIRLPNPPQMKNKRKNYVISLSELTRWLGRQAEAAGVDVFPGFAGKEVLYDWHNAVVGVATGDQGVGQDGRPKAGFAPGVDLLARLTLFGEGCRGSLSESLIAHYGLREAANEGAGACPQTYAIGLKEVWEVPEAVAQPGLVIHTVGFPLDGSTYGGGWIYHLDERRVSVGFVVALDYRNPWLSPYQEFQRFKAHPLVAAHLAGGTCLQYGARTLNEGGMQSIPSLVFPGGALVGCSAGFLNVPKIKGTHTAMKSGIIAGEEAFRALVLQQQQQQQLGQEQQQQPAGQEAAAAAPQQGGLVLRNYPSRLEASWVYPELQRARNIRPGFSKWGLWGGLANAALTTYITRGREPWTLRHGLPDHERLALARDCSPIDYPKPDGVTTFDLATSLYRSGTNHEHDQPSHLLLADSGVPERVNLPHYEGPETRYCPAGVYEYVDDEASGRRRLHINAQNCLHCKACSIKDPRQNIQWTVPEGGGGPNYSVM